MDYKINLEIFEGPLDLLLHLIKKEEVDICDIPIARILDQYMEYMRILDLLDINVAGEFLVMASTLMYIKSKLLLPPDPDQEEDEDDPRDFLVQQLIEYKKFKEIAGYLEEQEDQQANVFFRGTDDRIHLGDKEVVFKVGLFDLMGAFQEALKRPFEEKIHEIEEDEITMEECLADIVEILKVQDELSFNSLFANIRSRIHLLATFLAVLELIKIKEIIVFQKEQFGEILMRKILASDMVVVDSDDDESSDDLEKKLVELQETKELVLS